MSQSLDYEESLHLEDSASQIASHNQDNVSHVSSRRTSRASSSLSRTSIKCARIRESLKKVSLMAEASNLAQRQMLQRKEFELSLEKESLELSTKIAVATAKEELLLDVEAESTVLMWDLLSVRLPVWLMMFVWEVCLCLLVVASTVLMQSLLSARLPVWLMMFVLKVRLRWTTSVFPKINQKHNQRWLMRVQIYRHSLFLLSERWNLQSLIRLHRLYPSLGKNRNFLRVLLIPRSQTRDVVSTSALLRSHGISMNTYDAISHTQDYMNNNSAFMSW